MEVQIPPWSLLSIFFGGGRYLSRIEKLTLPENFPEPASVLIPHMIFCAHKNRRMLELYCREGDRVIHHPHWETPEMRKSAVPNDTGDKSQKSGQSWANWDGNHRPHYTD